MAILKKHWPVSVLILCVVTLGVGILLQTLLVPPVAISASPSSVAEEELSSAMYSQIASLRRALLLQDEDLAAMGCTETQAVVVLQAFRSWVASHQDSLDSASATVRQCRQEFLEARRAVNVGSADVATLASVSQLAQNLEEAQDAQTSLWEVGGRVALASLATKQVQYWQAMRKTGQMGEKRFCFGLTDEQALAMRKARSLQARTGEGNPLAALSATQASSLEQTRQRIAQNLTGVRAASEAVLPIPAEMLAVQDADATVSD